MPLRKGSQHRRVAFARCVTNQALKAAHSWAGLPLFPSRAEGFGCPIIEARRGWAALVQGDSAIDA